MNKQELAQKLKADLPEFIWKDRVEKYDLFLTGYYFVHEFAVDDDRGKNDGDLIMDDGSDLLWQSIFKILKNDPRFASLNNEKFIETLADSNYGGKYKKGIRIRISVPEITNLIYQFLIVAIRDWMTECDKLRKSTHDEEVIVLLHPDVTSFYVPWFLRDLKHIVGPHEDSFKWRLGVVNLKDWNLDSVRLGYMFSDSTGDCFGVGEGDLDEVQEILDDWCDVDLMAELLKVYPEAVNIKRYFITGWD